MATQAEIVDRVTAAYKAQTGREELTAEETQLIELTVQLTVEAAARP